MNITQNKLENARMELEIDVPIDKVEIEYKAVFEKIKKSVKIDGFRKGKAPVNLVEMKYKEYADQDVAENLTRSAFIDAINEEKLTPIAEPAYDYKKIDRNEPFTFKATFEIMPSIEIGKYTQVHANEKVCNITNDDIHEEINLLREKDAETIKKENGGVVQNGDLVSIKLKRIDNVKKDEIETVEFKDYSFIVGKSKDKYTVDKDVIGLKVDEVKEVTIKYPKDYNVSELANQKVTYLVKIIEINSMKLPELNDEYSKKHSYESLEDMKKKMKEMLEKYVHDKTKNDTKSEILKDIVENSKFDIPETMINSELSLIFQKTIQRFGFNAENIEQFASTVGIDPEVLRGRMRLEAEQSVKTTIVLSEVAKKEELKVTDEKYNSYLEQFAKNNSKTYEEVSEIIKKNNSRNRIENDILLESSLDFLYDNGKIKKQKPCSLSELTKENVT